MSSAGIFRSFLYRVSLTVETAISPEMRSETRNSLADVSDAPAYKLLPGIAPDQF
jgi:hypothetical protein